MTLRGNNGICPEGMLKRKSFFWSSWIHLVVSFKVIDLLFRRVNIDFYLTVSEVCEVCYSLQLLNTFSEFPIGFTIQLISFDKYSTSLVCRFQENHISWHSLRMTHFYYVSYLDVLALDIFESTIRHQNSKLY